MNELIKYTNGTLVLDVQVLPEEENVWLTQAQMANHLVLTHKLLQDTFRTSVIMTN